MEYLKRNLYFISAFVFSFIIYLLTLAPDLNFTDSGELAAVCSSLGIAHPTGYPLFTVLGYFWTLLPLPLSKIYMLNLFAALTTALSVAVMFKVFEIILLQLTKKYKIKKIVKKGKSPEAESDYSFVDEHKNIISFTALISALLFAFGRTVWSISNSIEVYSLEALIMSLIIFFILKASFLMQNNRYYMFTALLFGLGFSNHMTTVLLIPAVFFLFYKRPDELFTAGEDKNKFLLFLIIPFLIGLSFHLYMPLRSMTIPEFNWGWVSRNLEKYLYHVTGKQYQVWMFTGAEVFNQNMVKFINIFPQQLAYIGIIPFLYGFYILYTKMREIFWFALVIIITCLGYSFNYGIHDIETYFLASIIGIFIVSAAGLYDLALKIKKYYQVMIVLPFIALFVNFNFNDESDNYMVSEYSRIMVDNLHKDAIIITSQWDYFCSAFWYKQKIENYRPDVVVIEKELLRRTWYLEQVRRWYPQLAEKSKTQMNAYGEQLELFESGQNYNPAMIQKRFIEMINSFIDKNIDKRPVYLTLEVVQSNEDADVGAKYEKIPEGFAFRLEKEKKIYPVNVDKIYVDKFIKGFKSKDHHLVKGIQDLSATCIINIGRYAQMTNQTEVAQKAYRLAYKVDPNNEMLQQAR